MTHLDSLLCEEECDENENSNHLFFRYAFLWYKNFNWLSNLVIDHALQFCKTYVFSKKVRTDL
jgi:hypothetical protein